MTVWPGTHVQEDCQYPIDRELKMFLWVSVRALSELAGRLLQGSERHPVPLRQQAQMRISAERSLMAELTQEVAHAGMVLQIPGRQVLR